MKAASFRTITDTELRHRNGERVTVLRSLGPDDSVDPEAGPMFEVAFADGTTVSAFEDELTEVR